MSVSPAHHNSQPRIGTLTRVLSGISYFKQWDVVDVRALEKHVALLKVEAGDIVLEVSDLSPYDYFLVKGELNLTNAQGHSRTLACADLDANFPIAHLRPSQYQVECAAACVLLRFEASHLKRFNAPANGARSGVRFDIDTASTSGTWMQHPLVLDLKKRMRAADLPLPSMPTIATRVRKALRKEDMDMNKISKIVVADPAIAAQLVKLSNSAVFGAASVCDTVQTAMVRLGLERTANLVSAIALKGLFVSEHTYIKSKLLGNWQHSIQIAAMCAILSDLSAHLDEDRALLIGLLHEIGAIPILRLAEEYPDMEKTPGILDEILSAMVPEVSAMILKQWDFHADFIDAAKNSANWYRDDSDQGSYSDVLVVAHLHALVGQRKQQQLPRLDEVPAFQKLTVGTLSAKLSLQVLDDSKNRIRELQSLLG